MELIQCRVAVPPMPREVSILHCLTREQLQTVARVHLSAVLAGKKRSELASALKRGGIADRDLLAHLSRDELKGLCRKLGLSDIGQKKDVLRVRILRYSSAPKLRREIRTTLRSQGFRVTRDEISLPKEVSKERLREIHKLAVQHRRKRSKDGLFRKENILLKRIANGADVAPEKICPRLIEVKSGTEDELLFRYVGLHWSIPVSSGYGRRLRFLVEDESNGKLIGVIGLGDPVFGIGPRDNWIGWNVSDRRERLRNVMDAFVLGAVPPYSRLLCGKLIALLATSSEVRDAFRRKYDRRVSIIRGESLSAKLALVTTTSALGRSSVYNRLKDGERQAFKSVGFTQGSGEFQFLNGVYDSMVEYAGDCLVATAKHNDWGTGFRNRREVVKKCLADLGLNGDWLYHGIRREIFVAPLARNTRQYLCGEHKKLLWHNRSLADLFSYFRERWLLPRAARDPRYRAFLRNEYVLWD